VWVLQVSDRSSSGPQIRPTERREACAGCPPGLPVGLPKLGLSGREGGSRLGPSGQKREKGVFLFLFSFSYISNAVSKF